jgi:hypothetical protein
MYHIVTLFVILTYARHINLMFVTVKLINPLKNEVHLNKI